MPEPFSLLLFTGNVCHTILFLNSIYAVIIGIKVEIAKRVSQPVSTIADSAVQLLKGGIPVGNNYASPGQWPMTFSYDLYGSQTDLWGTTWTPADINSLNFGVRYRLVNGAIDQTAEVDHIRITVYYTLSTGMETLTGAEIKPAYIKEDQLLLYPDKKIVEGRLTLYDIAGNKIFEDMNYSGQPVSLSAYSKGIIIMHLESGNNRFH